jgi:hypothetical protein
LNDAQRKVFADQIRRVLGTFDTIRHRSKYDDLSDLPGTDHGELIALVRSVVVRITGPRSEYCTEIQRVLSTKNHDGYKAMQLKGIANALLADLETGALDSLAERIHGDVFSDFLEMASYLQDESFKDPAAVLAGGTLEAHLRQLCAKHSILVEFQGSRGTTPKKADQLNSDLAGANVYSKLDQKSVTAWLDLRNKAAHARYTEYTSEQVALLIEGVRDFLIRNPA